MSERRVEVVEGETPPETSLESLATPTQISTLGTSSHERMRILREEEDFGGPSKKIIPSRIEQTQQEVNQRILHRSLLQGLEPIDSVSEKSTTYHKDVPYILLFTNGTECIESRHLPVQITSPSLLSSNFPSHSTCYVVGPGLFDIEYLPTGSAAKNNQLHILSMENWQDGLALVHKFEIAFGPSDLSVTYKSRFSTYTLAERMRRKAQSSRKEIQADPNQWILSHLAQTKWHPDCSDINANSYIVSTGEGWTKSSLEESISIQPTGKSRLLTWSKYSAYQELDSSTLIPKRVRSLYQLNKEFNGSLVSKPIYDPSTKETIQAVLQTGFNPTYTIFGVLDDDRFDPPGHVIARINAQASHNFQLAQTRNFIVLTTFPYSPSFTFSKSLQNLKFDSNGITWFHVIDRHKRKLVATFRTAACFATSTLNAFERDGGIEMDMSTFDTDLIRFCWNLRNLRTLGMPPFPQGSVKRFVLPRISEASTKLKSGIEATFEFLSDVELEFPIIRKEDVGNFYRFAFGLSFAPESRGQMNQVPNAIMCLDVQNKVSASYWVQEGCYPGPPFLLNEDTICSVVLNARQSESFLIALHVNEEGKFQEIFRAKLPNPVPFYSSAISNRSNR